MEHFFVVCIISENVGFTRTASQERFRRSKNISDIYIILSVYDNLLKKFLIVVIMFVSYSKVEDFHVC